MKPSLLHAAPALLLGAALTLTGGVGAVAQTASSGSTTTSSSETQTGAAPAPAPSTQPSTQSPSATRRPRGQTMQQVVDARIRKLHSTLHITKKQEPEFDQFAQLMRQNAANLDREYRERASHVTSMSAPQNLESYARIEQTRAEDVQKLVPAFQTLYAALSPQQKHEADRLFRSYAERYRHGRQASR